MSLMRWTPGALSPVQDQADTSPVADQGRPVVTATIQPAPPAPSVRPVDGAARYVAATTARTAGLLVARAPIGAARIAGIAFRWVSDSEGRSMRRKVATGAAGGGQGTEGAGTSLFLGGGDAYVRVQQAHRDTQKERATVFGVAMAFLAVAVGVFAYVAPWWAHLGAGGAVVIALGVIGRPKDKPLITRPTHVVAADHTPPLTSELIVTALGALGISELNKAFAKDDKQAVRFVAPITRDGEGWRADIDLPAGTTAGDVVDKRGRLASGLRRPVETVWPEGDTRAHEGRLVLWVADRPASETPAAPWKYADTGRVNLFQPFSIGTDQRGRDVTLTLMYASGVVGAVPRMGKTVALRLFLLGAALDPRAEIHCHDLKGGADLLPLAPVAKYCRSGDEAEDIQALAADLLSIHTDMRRRYKTVRGLPADICPDGKVTDALASKRELGLWPVVIGLDECQIAFENEDNGDDIEAIITDLVKRGPAVGITVLVATQRPDAKSLPSGIRDNAVIRFCLRVTSQMANDMVLGTSAYKSGIRATTFSRSDLGTGYLTGDAADPVIVRTSYVDRPAAQRIVARAVADREALGLTFEPEEIEAAPTVPEMVASVWPVDGPEKLWFETIAELLTDAGHDLGADAVSAALRDAGLPVVQVYRDGRNRRGIARDALVRHLADRDGLA